MNKIICFLFGHKKSVPMLQEDFHCIYTSACPRCKTPSIDRMFWKIIYPPPNSTDLQIEEFMKNIEIYHQEIRDKYEKK